MNPPPRSGVRPAVSKDRDERRWRVFTAWEAVLDRRRGEVWKGDSLRLDGPGVAAMVGLAAVPLLAYLDSGFWSDTAGSGATSTTGGLASILVSFLVLGIIGIAPWDSGSAIALGALVAVVAPLGDLSESMLKRDLGVKDMGAVLPGHGGLLDRFDALLFCLPATYYLCRFLELPFGF